MEIFKALFWFAFSTFIIGVVSMGCDLNATNTEFGTMVFPPEFLFSTASSAYQIEGAWNLDGKGENIWDRMIHTNPERIQDGSNADIACDSYHKYEEDIQIVADLGFNIYRFSISWTRILPTGDITNVNAAGIQHYNNMIDKLLENGITPMITIYHWDLPQRLQDMGGWVNPYIADYMEDYADILFKQFGDRVKWWITINEPSMIVEGYQTDRRCPGLNLDSPADYMVIHNILRAHASVYRLYDEKYRPSQKGKITIALSYTTMSPKSNRYEDRKAAQRGFQFQLNIYAHPIFSMEGDYPKLVKEVVDRNSKNEGRRRSRLQVFTEEEKQAIKGSYDFFALNHYTTRLATPAKSHLNYTFERDMAVEVEVDPSWPASHAHWLKVVPSGFLEALLIIKNNYNNTPVFITENGYPDADVIEDCGRINYHRKYLNEVLKAIHHHGCSIIGYTAWTLLDNFEWNAGYKHRYGLVRVDFNDPERKRTLKNSTKFFKQLIKTRVIP